MQHPLSQAIRAAIFAENVAYILHHNERTAATGATFRLGINKFSDPQHKSSRPPSSVLAASS